MENEREVIRRITRAAQQDAYIRVLIMTGDRVNKAAVQQPLSRYEFTIAAEDPEQALASKVWEKIDDVALLRAAKRGVRTVNGIEIHNAWLLYEDMSRVSLQAVKSSDVQAYVQVDSLIQIMLDKDGVLPPMGIPTDLSRRTKAPSETRFQELFDRFFESAMECGIALKKDELLRALAFLSEARQYLLPATEYAIATEYDYLINLGDRGGNLKVYLDKTEYASYLRTYPSADIDQAWTSLFTACSLFRTAGMKICEKEQFAYPKRVDVQVMQYLRGLWDEQNQANR